MTASVAGSSVTPTRPRLPWVMLVITLCLVPAMTACSLGREPVYDTFTFGAIAVAFGSAGALVAARHPANPIGWIFCGLGVWTGIVELWESFAYHSWPTGDFGAWLVGWSWVVDGCAYAVVFLLFPNGRLLTSRWRWVLWLVGGAAVLAVPGQAFSPDNKDNPIAVDSPVLQTGFAVGMLLLLVAIGAGLVSLAVRYRRASGAERLQLRAFLSAGAIFIPTMTVAVIYYYESVAVQVVAAFALILLPTAAAVAILRYRLYDIDVVINRALVYGSLTATLAAVYVGSVLLLQVALSGLTEGSGLAVAASTLAVAAMFRPARARIQGIVDRRFFRSRYDARRTLESFGAQLRDEVDLSALSADLEAVVMETMRPAHVSLWVRDVQGSVR